jgi:hypothetical protein
MSTFLERLKTEEIELDEKINKLQVFVIGDIFAQLDDEDRMLLTTQLDVMQAYFKIIHRRRIKLGV